MKSKLAVVVQTCDKYHDLWAPFYTLFRRYWPDCAYPVYHVTEGRSLDQQGIHQIHTGALEWSARLLFCLDRIDADYILLLLDDYFLLKPAYNSRFEECCRVLDDHANVACLRIFPVPGPTDGWESDPKIGRVDRNTPYAITTQVTIWRKKCLQELLVPSETVWQFEVEGSRRAANYPFEFLSLNVNHSTRAEEGDYPFTYLCTAVYKGKWMREAVELSRREKLDLDFDYRKVESGFDRFYRLNYEKSPTFFRHVLDFVKFRKLL